MLNWEKLGIDIEGHEGQTYSTCPKCSKHRRKKQVKCLSVNTEEGVWNCHHCGWSGSLKKGEYAAASPNLWAEKEYVKPQPLGSLGLTPAAVKWLATRSISKDTAQMYGVTVDDAYMPQVEEWRQTLCFPYNKDGELVNVKYRMLDEKFFRMVGGAEKLVFGYDHAADSDTVIWVEGEIDALSLAEVGYYSVVSVPDGAPNPDSKAYDSKFDWLDRMQDWLEGKTHILAVDSDEPGQVLEAELARRIGKYDCKRVLWPKGCKDANDVLTQLGHEALIESIEQARPFPVTGMVEVDDLRQDVLSLYHEGLQGGVSTGWDEVDRHYRPQLGQLTIVTGMPSCGKSEFLDALTVNLAMQHDWRFAVYSPENWPVQRHVAKLVEKVTHKPFGEGPTKRVSSLEIDSALDWLQDYYCWILPKNEEDLMTVDHVLEIARGIVRQRGIKGLVIDPWNEIDHTRPQGLSETEYISQALTKFRLFARTHGVHLWVVAHPRKLHKDDSGKYPPPTLYDISGSANWRNKADNGLTVHRDIMEKNGTVEIHVQKIRFKETGSPGVATLSYDHVCGIYSDPVATDARDEDLDDFGEGYL